MPGPIALAVEPDEPTARRWLVDELKRAEYDNSTPGALDRLREWLSDLLGSADGVPAPIAVVIGLVLLVAAVAVILLVSGRVRLQARPGEATGALFEDEILDAQTHRRLAAEHAAAGLWNDAIREATRGLIRSLQERVLIDSRPGMTADEAAQEAAARLPGLGGRLADAARTFDEVTFGGRAGTQAGYEAVRSLDHEAERTTPLRHTPYQPVGGPDA